MGMGCRKRRLAERWKKGSERNVIKTNTCKDKCDALTKKKKKTAIE